MKRVLISTVAAFALLAAAGLAEAKGNGKGGGGGGGGGGAGASQGGRSAGPSMSGDRRGARARAGNRIFIKKGRNRANRNNPRNIDRRDIGGQDACPTWPFGCTRPQWPD